MAELEPRNVQTRVKHEILSRYLDTWGGIIVGGLTKARKPLDWHFVYVDCFSYLGKYSKEKEDTYYNQDSESVEGSPIIGIKALDKLLDHAWNKMGVRIRVNSILIEKDKKTYTGLLENLQEAGYGHRIRETKDFHSLAENQIAIVNDDATLPADELVAYTTHPSTWAFYLIDPYGPSGIPYEFVKKIVSQDHHDVMINFIYEDLLRKTGMCLKENPSPSEKKLINYWSKAFGGDWWIELARETLLNEELTRNFRDALDGIPMSDMEEGTPFTDEELAEVKEQTFVSAYRDVLRSMDNTLVTKLVNLRFGDKERTMFYLFLTTHDATGALSLNRILRDAKYLEHELRHRLKLAKQTAPRHGQMTLWTIVPYEVNIPEPQKAPRPSNEEVGNYIMEKLVGKKLTRKDLYKELANTLYFPEEVDKALRFLRRAGLANFEGNLSHKTIINFSEKE